MDEAEQRLVQVSVRRSGSAGHLSVFMLNSHHASVPRAGPGWDLDQVLPEPSDRLDVNKAQQVLVLVLDWCPQPVSLMVLTRFNKTHLLKGLVLDFDWLLVCFSPAP